MKNDLVPGILFVVIGLMFNIYSRAYEIGTASDMGPGYFPLMTSSAIIIIGLVLILRSKFWKS